jgi:hypothetical protein
MKKRKLIWELQKMLKHAYVFHCLFQTPNLALLRKRLYHLNAEVNLEVL